MIDGRRRLTRSGLGPRIPEVARRGRELRARSSARARRVACHAGTSCTGASSRFPDRPTRWANPRSTCSGRDLCGHAAVDYRRPSRRPTISSVACGCSAVGSASPCQGEGRGFESRHPLEGAVASTPAVEWPSGEATACKAVHTGSIPVSTSNGFPGAISSAGERFPDTEEVTGSIPVSRTTLDLQQRGFSAVFKTFSRRSSRRHGLDWPPVDRHRLGTATHGFRCLTGRPSSG